MPYAKGESGNRKGRPKGRRDRRTLLFEKLVPYGDALVSKAVVLALDGDTQMLALCLNKLIPNPRPIDRGVGLENFSGSLSVRGEQVVEAMSSQKIALSEGAALLDALQIQARLVEADELERRVTELEHAAADSR